MTRTLTDAEVGRVQQWAESHWTGDARLMRTPHRLENPDLSYTELATIFRREKMTDGR